MNTPSLAVIIQQRPEPFVCCTEDGTVLFTNRAWEMFCAEVFRIPFQEGRGFFDQIPSPLADLWRELADLVRQPQSPSDVGKKKCDHQGYTFTVQFSPFEGMEGKGWSLLVRQEQGLWLGGAHFADSSQTIDRVNDHGVPEDCHPARNGKRLQGPPAGVSPARLPDRELPLHGSESMVNVLLAKEIADRKQAEASLQENKDRLTQIIHGNSIPTFVIDQNHRITHWNKALERLTGISSRETLGTNEQWKAFYAFNRPTMADLILDQATEEKINEFYTKKYVRSKLLEDSYEVEDFFELNGKQIWLFFTAAPIKSRSGVLIGAVETLQDITSRKILEAEILHHQTILENKVEERTLQLKKTYEQLLHAEKLSAVGKLAASIAHEFGNPIIGIRNFLKEIQKTTAFDADDAELLQLAIQECQRVKDLISNLQSFNRPTNGHLTSVDLHQALNDMLLFCKKSFKEKRILVKKKLDAHLPLIHGVHDQIKQVILNCLNNAQEAIANHGGTIQVSTEHTEQTVFLHIRDSGKGIAESDIVYIFEPFFSTKPAVEGTGLGLSVSYGIMKGLQGNIEVTDTSRHGTTFTLSFPVPQA